MLKSEIVANGHVKNLERFSFLFFHTKINSEVFYLQLIFLFKKNVSKQSGNHSDAQIYLVSELSDRVILFEVGEDAEAEFEVELLFETSSTLGFDEMRLALSRKSDNNSTEVK